MIDHPWVIAMLGVAALVYVAWKEAPERRRVGWTALASAAVIALYVVLRPRLAPQADPSSITAAAAWWLPAWAALLHDSSDDDDERGPWVLALLPLAITAVFLAVGTLGGGWSEWRPLLLLGWLVAAYVVAVGFYSFHGRKPR